MPDALSLLEQDRKKLAAKVERLRTQLEAAESELSDSDAAIRVFKRLGIAVAVEGVASDDARGNSQTHVLAKLATTEAEAKAPKEVHAELTADGFIISADNVRTILSRLSKPDASGRAAISSKDSRYWRTASEASPEEASAESAQLNGERSRYHGAAAVVTFDDHDRDVPFDRRQDIRGIKPQRE